MFIVNKEKNDGGQTKGEEKFTDEITKDELRIEKTQKKEITKSIHWPCQNVFSQATGEKMICSVLAGELNEKVVEKFDEIQCNNGDDDG